MANWLWVHPADISTPELEEKFLEVLDSGAFQHILFELYHYKKYVYKTGIMPESKLRTQDGSRYLDWALKQCLERNIKLHAWQLVNIPFVWKNAKGWRDDFEYSFIDDGKTLTSIDLGNYKFVRLMINTTKELLENYSELSGIHWDYIRYHGTTVTPEKYSVQTVTDLVAQGREVTRGYMFTAAVTTIRTRRSKHTRQDWPAWLGHNLIDKALTMSYASMHEYYSYPDLLSDYIGFNPNKIGAGMYLSKLDGIDEANREIQLAKRLGYDPAIFSLSELRNGDYEQVLKILNG